MRSILIESSLTLSSKPLPETTRTIPNHPNSDSSVSFFVFTFPHVIAPWSLIKYLDWKRDWYWFFTKLCAWMCESDKSHLGSNLPSVIIPFHIDVSFRYGSARSHRCCRCIRCSRLWSSLLQEQEWEIEKEILLRSASHRNLSYLSASSRMLSVPNPSEYMLVSLLLSPSLDSLPLQPFISLF